jgi:predicted ATPase
MIISKLKIKNYKSFLDSEAIKFTKGFNIVIGKNNSGKTALTEILSLGFTDHPHLSLITKPEKRFQLKNSLSRVEITTKIDSDELQSFINNYPSYFFVNKNPSLGDEQNHLNFVASLENKSVQLLTNFRSGGHIDSAYYLSVTNPSQTSSTHAIQYELDESDKKLKMVTYAHSPNNNREIAYLLSEELKTNIFTFRAERYKVGQSKIGVTKELNPDASNLPEALGNLRLTNRYKYDTLLEHITLIFPDVLDTPISIIDETKNEGKIYLSSTPQSDERDDLLIALQDSGTGISQVLSILFVVTTLDYPTTIVIDEPHSFLHPGAVRKLFSILIKNYSQHQYIITTHSPTVLASANPANIIQLTKENFQTKIHHIDINETNNMRIVLRDVGASLSDVFGADNILWVEGKTEEYCFPKIIQKICKNSLLGTAVAGILNTGDFDSSKKKTITQIISIYDRLSKSTALLPPAIAFVFDREDRSTQDIQDLEKRGINFLPIRQFENYLIIPEAIAKHLQAMEECENPPFADDIKAWLETNKWKSKFFSKKLKEEEKTNQNWFVFVRGSILLDEIYRHYTKSSYEEYKAIYGSELTDLIINIEPSAFNELVDLLDNILQSNTSSSL